MRALVSVSDKTGLVPFVQGLQALGWTIIATGGTQKLLESSGVKTVGISESSRAATCRPICRRLPSRGSRPSTSCA